jgi:hypothetical protein
VKITATGGWAIELVDIAQPPRATGQRRAAVPLVGTQFAVTRHGFIVGYCRRAAGLRKLGVPASVVQIIEEAAADPRKARLLAS